MALQVHTTDGIEFVKQIAKMVAAEESCRTECLVENKDSSKIDILIIDVNSEDPRLVLKPRLHIRLFVLLSLCSMVVYLSLYMLSWYLWCSSGLSCPAADFVEEPFLNDAKCSISKQGLFVVNLVSRSTKIKQLVISKMKMVRA